MKRYKLLRDLPTFKAGEMFYLDERGNLCAEDTQGHRELVAYMKSTLEKFPNILEEWFKKIEEKPTRLLCRPLPGRGYCFIDTYNYILPETDERAPCDDARWSIGNYFATEKEAKRVLEKIKAYMTIKRDAKGFEPKANEGRWFIVCFTSHNKKTGLAINYGVFDKLCGVIYFATEEDADYSLKAHRKEWELLFDLDLEEKC